MSFASAPAANGDDLNAVMEEAAAEARLTMGTLGRCTDYALVGVRGGSAQPSRAGLKAAASTPKRAICAGTGSPRIRAA